MAKDLNVMRDICRRMCEINDVTETVIADLKVTMEKLDKSIEIQEMLHESVDIFRKAFVDKSQTRNFSLHHPPEVKK